MTPSCPGGIHPRKLPQYRIRHGGLLPFDGDGMEDSVVDTYVQETSYAPLKEGLRAGSLLEVPHDEVGRSVGRSVDPSVGPSVIWSVGRLVGRWVF